MLRTPAILVVTLLASPAFAGATPWQDLAPGTKGRLISSDTIVNGKSLVGLELDMPADTKTYWRIPGEAGIPPELDFAGSTGLSGTRALWPYPEIDTSAGVLDYVYHGHIVLPVEITAGAGATIDATAMLGICSDICVPAQAKFTLPLGASPDAEQALRLDQAVATVPVPWDQSSPPFGPITAVPHGLEVASIDPAIDPASIIVDVGDPSQLFAAPQKSPDGTAWLLKRLGDSGAQGLEGRTVELTFQTRSGPYAASQQIAAAR